MEPKSGLLWPGFPPLGDQIPLNDFLSRKRPFQELSNWRETTIFIVVSRNSCPLSAPPPKSPARPHPDTFTILCLFRGGDFCTFSFFFVGLVFFIPSFLPLWTMKTLETPCFIVFQLPFRFEKFGLPEAPLALFFVDFEPFSKIGLKNAKKNSKHRVVNSAGWITSPFPPCVCSFLQRPNYPPSADLVLGPTRVNVPKPLFL